MNHVILFLYILLIAVGTGGVVALAILHSRLRIAVTRYVLIATGALALALLVELATFYLDEVVSDGTSAWELSGVRTVIGWFLGVTIYGAMARTLFAIPGASHRLTAVTAAAIVSAMTVQTALILAGARSIARMTGPWYLVAVSAGLIVLGVLLIRSSVAPDAFSRSPTVGWLLRRLGWLTASFGALSPFAYLLLASNPYIQSLGISLDFLFYAIWCLLSIAALMRYLTRPAAIADGEEISTAFLSAFGITPREQEIVRLVGQGLSNREIAERLSISFGTVRTHVYNIFQKTGAGSRVDLLRLVQGFRE